jgi:rubrerythrin
MSNPLLRPNGTAFINHYRCPTCRYEWTDEWSSTCDDDCPSCGARHISPRHSEDGDAALWDDEVAS